MTNEQIINNLEKIIANAKKYESCSMDDDALCYDYLMTGVEKLLKELKKEGRLVNA